MRTHTRSITCRSERRRPQACFPSTSSAEFSSRYYCVVCVKGECEAPGPWDEGSGRWFFLVFSLLSISCRSYCFHSVSCSDNIITVVLLTFISLYHLLLVCSGRASTHHLPSEISSKVFCSSFVHTTRVWIKDILDDIGGIFQQLSEHSKLYYFQSFRNINSF